jgi:hypothetical protein
MSLHDTIEIDTWTEVLRVHGGWIYKFKDTNSFGERVTSSTFVKE